MELIVQSNNEEKIKTTLKGSMGKDDKILTVISGNEGKDFKTVLDRLEIKNNAIYTIENEMVKVERLEKELIEDEEITHVAAIINGKVDNLPLMKLAKRHNKILINVEQ